MPRLIERRRPAARRRPPPAPLARRLVGRRLRRHARVKALSCATMRISHEASDGSALMRLMKAAPRGARGEQLLERDDLRALPRDRLERLERVGVGKRFSVGQIGMLLQRGEVFRCRDQDGG